MPEFAFLFRAGRALPAEEVKARNVAARAWAIENTNSGVITQAAPLEDHGMLVTAKTARPMPAVAPVLSVLIINAGSFEEALEIAKGHPGQAFGTEIEVRPLKSVQIPEAPKPR
jgi:hypothetical protein